MTGSVLGGSALEVQIVGAVVLGVVLLTGLRTLGPVWLSRRRTAGLVVAPGKQQGEAWWNAPSRGVAAAVWLRWLPLLVRRFRWLTPGSEAEHAELLEAVARSLRAGSSLFTALEHGVGACRGRVAAELDGALLAARNGAQLGPTLDAWADSNDPVRTVAGSALALGAELGGARARALDDAAAGLRDRAALAGEIRALTSQARASAAVMVLAPLGFAVFGWFADAGLASVFATPLGAGCLVAGLTLDAAGAWWMAAWTRRVS
jgi:Flp pilus assembly protein TadB